ncbi:hypothetical protein SCLCIDRAFT_1211219 [Scleroderma citrinum Foug A]|uniref:Uncharacterized protein n=1 Tax=Scleroderma citrinum Foug A TaxID=1036808 RepID=A0A0C3EDR1_9AGAM|nr:hypothetical protein SCLCIDRAFT_1211219 [Scleroderma citrinum Foug A]
MESTSLTYSSIHPRFILALSYRSTKPELMLSQTNDIAMVYKKMTSGGTSDDPCEEIICAGESR